MVAAKKVPQTTRKLPEYLVTALVGGIGSYIAAVAFTQLAYFFTQCKQDGLDYLGVCIAGALVANYIGLVLAAILIWLLL